MRPKDGADAATLTRIRDAAHRKSNQSPLLQWFQRNHAGFAAIMARQPKPGWDVVAAELTADGITMANGKPVTPAYARHTWWKVQRYRGALAKTIKQAAQPPAKPQPVTPPAPASPDPRPGPAFDPLEGSDAPLTRTTFRPSGGLKKWPSADPKALAVSAQPSMEPSRPAPAFDPMETADAPRPAPRFGVSRLRD